MVSFRLIRRCKRATVDPEDLRQAAVQCGLRTVSLSDQAAVFRRSLNWWTYGETVSVFVLPIDGACLIDVSSKPRVFWAVVDWGQNEKNVRKLLAVLTEQWGDDVVGEVIQLCPACDYPILDPQAGVCSECGADLTVDVRSKRRFRRRLRGSLAGIALLTAVEYGLCVLLDSVGVHTRVADMFHTRTMGPVVLALLNLAVFSSIWFFEWLCTKH